MGEYRKYPIAYKPNPVIGFQYSDLIRWSGHIIKYLTIIHQIKGN